MPKKVTSKKIEDDETIAPQLTFLEEEHKSLVDYMNNVTNYAVFNGMNEKQMHEAAVVKVKAINVIKKIEEYIFDFKRTIKQGSK